MNKSFSKAFGLTRCKIAVLIIGWMIVLLISGCATKQLAPLSLPVLESDNKMAEFPPSDDELISHPNILVLLIVFKDKTVTADRLQRISNFIQAGFEKHGNFKAVSQETVDEFLARDENSRFQVSNIADAIQLGTALNATFVSQMEITILESKLIKGVDHFRANVNQTIFTTNSGQVVFRQNVSFDTNKIEESSIEQKALVQEYFPLRGFIMETRGGNQVARITLGRNSGIKLGREFLVRKREVKSQMVEGISRKTISFSTIALATVKVIKIMEDDSWVVVEKGDRQKIKIGQVVFSQKEKGSSLF